MADDKQAYSLSRFRKLGQRVGQVVTMVAVLFLALELYRQWGNVKGWRPTAGGAGLLVALALAYGASLVLLAYNWFTILTTLLGKRLPVRRVLLSHTQTQIGKYVPGNIFHFVSRHLYLNGLGLPHRPIALATVYEIVSLPLAALCVVLVILPFADVAGLVGWSPYLTYFLLIFLLLSLAVGAVTLMYRSQRRLIRPIAIVLARASVFMLFQGLIFALILQVVSTEFVFIAIPIAILAWLVGFVTPGAPGGIAVREALLVKLLAIAALPQEVLISALLFRFVTSAGDLAVYGFGRVFFAKADDQHAFDRD